MLRWRAHCAGDAGDLDIALHHFNKTRLVANGLVRRAEEVLGSAGRADEGVSLRAARLLSEASSIFQSIGCVRRAATTIHRARELTMAAQ